MSDAVTLVVLTEDAGTSGWAPVVACVRAVCDTLIGGIDWTSVRVLPREDAPDDVLRAVGANRWKGTDGNAHALRVQLARYIANQLLASDGEKRFVFFHFDADQRWSDGPIAAAENSVKFEVNVRTAVAQHLRGALEKRRRSEELPSLMARLHGITPCCSIESWLYQNTLRATSLCRARACAGAHASQYDAWAADRSALDDVPGLKDRRDLHCLNDRDKEALSKGLPHREMRAVGRSFSATVDEVGEDGALLDALVFARADQRL